MGKPSLKISRNKEIQVKNLQKSFDAICSTMEHYAATKKYYGSYVQQHPESVHVNL